MGRSEPKTWEEKLSHIRRDLEAMVEQLNRDRDYDGALAVQEALQKVARLDDKIGSDQTVVPLPFVSDREWKPVI